MAATTKSPEWIDEIETQTVETEVKQRVEVRLEEDIYKPLLDQATQAGITVSQLITGLADWASRNLNQGKPFREKDDENEIVKVQTKHKCLFLGRRGQTVTEWLNQDGDWSEVVEIEEPEEHIGIEQYTPSLDWNEEVDRRQRVLKKGIIYGILDFNPSIGINGDEH